MYSLIVDSSTKILYISLVKDNEIIFEKYVEGKNDHAKNIVSTINEALTINNINVDNLNKIIVGNGPGSYTGVRMAVTVAKMMATFKNVELYTVSTLKLMASGYSGVVVTSIDARRGNAFAAVFDLDNNQELLSEGMYSYDMLNQYEGIKVNENEFKVNPIYCINNSEKVLEPHLLVPNYLRDTEAERNLK